MTKSNGSDLNKVPVFIPRNIMSVWGDYQVQDGHLAGLGFGLGVRYIGFTYGDNANVLKVPGFALVDAAISYDMSRLGPNFEGWRFVVNAANLFDNKYVSECSSSTSCLYGLRRTVLASLRKTW